MAAELFPATTIWPGRDIQDKMMGITMAVKRIHIATNKAFEENSAPIDRDITWLGGCVGLSEMESTSLNQPAGQKLDPRTSCQRWLRSSHRSLWCTSPNYAGRAQKAKGISTWASRYDGPPLVRSERNERLSIVSVLARRVYSEPVLITRNNSAFFA
jgi:hypothetical protein